VASLTVAWTYRTGEIDAAFATEEETCFEATPLMVDSVLYLSTPLGRVIALDPATGGELWVHDPGVDRSIGFGDFTNRGVSTWLDTAAAAGSVCRRRIFATPIDGRIVALDAASGEPCRDLGPREPCA
jgi:quinoprotein glucose dehydrogenase